MAAAKSYLDGVNDPRFKPRILSSLLHDFLPDAAAADDRPLPDPSHLLPLLVAAVKEHSLLSERFSGSASPDPKLVQRWKSSVDSWVDRCLALLASKLPDNCWAGICLLGVTFEECSSDRFLACYSLWFQKLIALIQPSADSQFVKVACCSALSDLFTRLSIFPSVKKDSTSLAGRLVPSILKLLTEESSVAILEGCVDVLTVLVTNFPSSIRRHFEDVEAAIALRVISKKSNTSITKKFSRCLALLPNSKGDENSWFSMLQKILILINDYLSDAFQGLEAESKKDEFGRILVRPGETPPPSLGGQQLAGDNVSSQVQIYNVCALMQCCCMMLTNPYPVQVPVPVHLLVSFIERILSVDGSLYMSMLPFATVMQQELVCLELPVLHLSCLDLLVAVIKSVRSQLLPHSARIAILLSKYSKRCLFSSVRVKMYSVMRTLLISLGAGIALYLAKDVIANAFDDLCFSNSESGHAKVSNKTLLQPCRRKRKRLPESPAVLNIESNLEGSKHSRNSSLTVQVAALQAIETLITVGGSMKSENWRTDVERFLVIVATDACAGGSASEKDIFLSEDLKSARTDFQLAAFQALLSSILSPSRVRPPYLSQALDLFRRGRRETGTKLSLFCTSALPAIEVLIHPRALPLHEFAAFSRGFSANVMNNGTVENMQGGFRGINENREDDELYDSYLENIEQNDSNDQIPGAHEQTREILGAREQIRDTTNQIKGSDALRDEPMREGNDSQSGNEMTICLDTSQVKVNEDFSTKHAVSLNMAGQTHPLSTTNPLVRVEVTESRKVTLPAEDLATEKNAAGSTGVDSLKMAKVDSEFKGFFFFNKGKRLNADSDECFLDPLPDIVDADPDTSDAESESE